MTKSLNFTDNNEYGLTNSINEMFDCKPWKVPITNLIYNSCKEPIAFVFLDNDLGINQKITQLPTEFFNHQLLYCNYEDPKQVEKFMNTYGVFNLDMVSYRKYRHFKQMLLELDIENNDSVSSFVKKFGGFHDPSIFQSSNLWQSLKAQNYEIKVQLLLIMKRLEEEQKDIPVAFNKKRIVGFQTIQQAKQNYKNWVFAAKRIKALLMYRTPLEIAKYTGDDPCSVISSCKEAVNIVQRELKSISPVLGLLDLSENQNLTHNGEYFGSLEQALALQLWNFTLEARGGLSICKECKEPFVRKQSKSKTNQSRSSRLFCCERCKNRYTQRKYRKSPGYRQKQNKAKQKAETKES